MPYEPLTNMRTDTRVTERKLRKCLFDLPRTIHATTLEVVKRVQFDLFSYVTFFV